jgi:hypothetical protein
VVSLNSEEATKKYTTLESFPLSCGLKEEKLDKIF